MSKTLASFSIQQEVQLRFLSPSDIPDIKLLCADWFPIEYPDSWYEDITSNCKFYSLAATHSSRIIGIIVCEVKTRARCNREDADILASYFAHNTRVAYILSLGVVDDFRRLGIASMLLDSLISFLTSDSLEHYDCKALYLHVLTSNTTAIRFYERRSFHLHNYLPYYYSIQGQPHDGFCYVLYINGGQPPWSLFDYFKHVGDFLMKLHPCAIPQRLLASMYGMWNRAIGLKPTSYQIHNS